ncbi:MAG TPA: 23S rRNA (guanosine(2251)-2'-O)-methyltransferase RlmB [Hyphomicrobiales bacterium]|nr:23S rRNA (guanosine(2251)-2'-O)-methyltransferase RlmB [Hyphomicrobiales bacterium]
MTAPRSGRDRRGGPHAPRPPASLDRAVLYGFHSVAEALKNPKRVPRRLLATENALARLREAGIVPAISPEIVRPDALDRLLTPDAVHQGLYLEAEPLPALEIEDLPDHGLVLVLDQITDPHNVGAIVRTAAAFAADAIVTTQRHSPAATGVLAKAASGGLEHVPLVTVRNLGAAILDLRDHGYRCVGLDSEAEMDLAAAPLARPLALVLGAEGKGLRQKTRSLCDTVAAIGLPGAVKSLNVSNAAAIALALAALADGRP